MAMLRREKLAVVRRNNRNTLDPADFPNESAAQLRLQQDLDLVDTELNDLRAEMEAGAQKEEDAREGHGRQDQASAAKTEAQKPRLRRRRRGTQPPEPPLL